MTSVMALSDYYHIFGFKTELQIIGRLDKSKSLVHDLPKDAT